MRKIFTLLLFCILISCGNEKEDKLSIPKKSLEESNDKRALHITLETLELLFNERNDSLRIVEIMDSLNYTKYSNYSYKSSPDSHFKFSANIIDIYPFISLKTFAKPQFIAVQDQVTDKKKGDVFEDGTRDLAIEYDYDSYYIKTFYPYNKVIMGRNTRYEILFSPK